MKSTLFEKFALALGYAFMTIAVIAVAAFLGGTIVYWVWPVAIPAAFPGLVASGVLAAKLAWWQAVCLTWIFGIMIKSSQTNNNKKD